MAELNVFKADGFSTINMTNAIENFDTIPGMLGGMGIFQPKPVTSKDVMIEVKDETAGLIGLVPRGAPLQQYERGNRKKINFEVPKIGEQETIWGHEIAGLRAFGSMTEEMRVMDVVAQRLLAQRQNIDYTKEYMRLAAIQGKFLDPADGSVVYDYFTELGVTEGAAVSFELDVDTTLVKQIAEELVISVQRTAKGAWVPGQTRLHAIVGDAFWFALTQHPNVEKYYNNYAAMAVLKDLDPSEMFDFGGIVFHRYMGSDDNSEIAVATDEAKFFPVGARDVFDEIMAPADEWIEYVGAPGQSVYALRKQDREYDTPRWVGYDVVSYPLFICNRPNLLRKGTRT